MHEPRQDPLLPTLALSVQHRWHHQIFFYPGYVLALGSLADQTEHSHLALELAIALDGDLLIGDGRDRRIGHQCLFAAGAPHRLRANGRVAALWVDPAWRRFGAMAPEAGDLTPAEYRRLVHMFRTLDRSEATARQVAEIIDLWVSARLGGLADAPALDERIATALDLIHVDDVPRTDRYRLAAEVGLSPSRFAALFAQDVGVSVRGYLIWRRLIQAVRCLCQGASVTSAAQETGFADAAHLSRLYRQTFGSSPSLLLTSRTVVSEYHPARLAAAEECSTSAGDSSR